MNGKNSVDQAAVQTSPSPNLKPWAAYVLGHDCVFIRKWQVLCGFFRGEQGTVNAVPNAVAEITDSLEILKAEITSTTAKKIQIACRKLVELTQPRKTPKGRKYTEYHFFHESSSKGYPEWSQLMSLSETIVGPMKPWQELGAAVARFRLKLSITKDKAQLGSAISLKEVLRRSADLVEQG
ncbi:hypothetical protein LOC68_09700 [Blastopirellula sp. JC732]|uniref:Uncharacterized protein n=1 Tax=Blastopirellula sediminis TaxID=2894196 RepID=A0A9X1MML4_9BACT|nr:hypothetical protein [Blastopirellula sediminis]MCC9608551.1 hypothetical protein [Blastopirellula sediminis]MCC9628672.1 hypothetical protein [Blastopirellula sediminis]